WYLIGATAAASMLRARVWDSANCKRALLAQPVLLGLSLIVMFAVNGNFAGAGWTLLGLAVLTLGVVIVAANPGLAEPDAYSIPMRRVVGLCSAGLDAALIPVMAYLVGIFAWVLNR
ncbi:type VII secretion integral membrane protein EccD, partial [Mycolicibacterium insubricum]|nr:type VII secretion integral membrane protein EccD [Mycolicibacterium insubricum]